MTDRDPSAYEDEYVVESMDDMYNIVAGSIVCHMDPFFIRFRQHYEAINVGCGCNKKRRIAAARVSYRELADISPEMQLNLKRALKAYKVILKDLGEVIVSFDSD